MKYETYKTLNEMDESGIYSPDLFLTGSLNKSRSEESPKTPKNIAELMVAKLDFSVGNKLLEPCSGNGGILDVIMEKSSGHEIYFNEIDSVKKILLKERFPSFHPTEFEDSLLLNRDKPVIHSASKRYAFHKIVMNPPFNIAGSFLSFMIDFYLNKTGEIVTLFPRYELARLKSNKELYLRMLTFSKISIEDVCFDCDYGAAVVLIHLKR